MAKHRQDPGLIAALREGKKLHGSLSAFARVIGIKPQSLCKWDQVPPERCPAVNEATGVPLNVLRPDIYPASDTKRLRQSAHA